MLDHVMRKMGELSPLVLSVQVVPILRAGLVLLEQAATVLPNSQTLHVGYVRNEETLEVSTPGALPGPCCHAAGICEQCFSSGLWGWFRSCLSHRLKE